MKHFSNSRCAKDLDLFRRLSSRVLNTVLVAYLSIGFLISFGIATAEAQTITFTGDPESDFSGDGVVMLDDGFPDVGLPAGFPFSPSGWDIKKAYFFTNLAQLSIGLDYHAIAGDGDPNSASNDLIMRGGQDFTDMADVESIAIEIDLDQDGTFDVVAGVPAGDPPAGPTPGCTDFDLNDCFGLYNHTGVAMNLGMNFASLISPLNNMFALPSAAFPDIEFTIEDWNVISGWDIGEPDTCESFSFDVRIFSGSFQDDGIGEDFIPNAAESTTVTFDVCTDCAGVAFGTMEVDLCGVCGGDNSTCLDCAGIPNGNSVIDECGVCAGDNTSCADCAGIPNGPNFINQCGECSDSDPPFVAAQSQGRSRPEYPRLIPHRYLRLSREEVMWFR